MVLLKLDYELQKIKNRYVIHMNEIIVILKRKFRTLLNLMFNFIVGPVKRYRYGKRLRNTNFTIIASNCIGAKFYQELGIEYNTPFVGLFIHAPCYLKLLKNLDYYLNSELKFIKKSKYQGSNSQLSSNHSYPIGLLGGDVEIHFLHYKNETDARTKWERRLKRMNMQNVFFTFTDRDCCNQTLIEEFDKIPFSNKVCFTAHNHDSNKSTVWLPEYQDQDNVDDLYRDFPVLKRHFDFIQWLNCDDGA